MLKIALMLALIGLAPASAPAAGQKAYRAVTVAQGFVHPWGMAFLPDGRMLVTERPGRLRIVTASGQISKPVSGLPEIAAIGQGGLLDVALHPDFKTNALIYFSFAEPGPGGQGTAVARARLEGLSLLDVTIIFRQQPKLSGGFHFGSRLVFARDGTLYISMGDRGRMGQAQNRRNHQGTIARVNDDGSIPGDNPFIDHPDALPEIYTYGNRNVQGMALNPWTGIVWAQEHGPKGGDEVNILKAGANYGWPVITYGIDYDGSIISDLTHKKNMEQPVLHWTPSIAPSGMAFYDGERFPQWRGDLFVGALKDRHLRRIDLDGDKVVGQEILLEELNARIRDVRAGPDGYLWVLTDAPRGRLIRIEPR
ncbi:MAG: PQQ-dependent sugar dehydrogenase [Proteobacteria bacterium]|nr:PQQ-dependent sugar dehydrogenase [Pseudomonadota bacterium]